MRIHYYAGSTLPSTRANAVHVLKMAQAFATLGHAVRLHAKQGAGRINDIMREYGIRPSFELQLAPLGTVAGVSGALRLAHALMIEATGPRPDAIYSRDEMVLWLMRGLGRPLYYESHQIPDQQSARARVMRLCADAQCGGMIVISHALQEDWARMFAQASMRHPRFHVAHDGADLPDPAHPVHLQTPWPGRPGIPQIGYTGSLHQGRGIDLIFSVAHRLPEVDFHIIGGTTTDVAYWKNQHPPFNILFHGHVAHRLIPAYLAQCDIVLAPYQATIAISTGADIARWISPMKLFEYMAHRKAIVCSDLPVLREILTHGRHALMVTPDRPADWVDAITGFLHHPDLRDQYASAAYAHVAAHYTWTARARAIAAFIDEKRA